VGGGVGDGVNVGVAVGDVVGVRDKGGDSVSVKEGCISVVTLSGLQPTVKIVKIISVKANRIFFI